jgi:hypothetical protein
MMRLLRKETYFKWLSRIGLVNFAGIFGVVAAVQKRGRHPDKTGI